jgi:GTP-binding protein
VRGIDSDPGREFIIVNITSAIFQCSAPNLDSCPDASLPEFAFIGRSNVGKSSLLNMLAGKERLARVSPTPGFTKLINFFTVDRKWRLVDLPGYGFAQVAHGTRTRFNRAVADYLEHRKNLSCIFLLIDSGLPPQEIDVDFVQWLAGHALPFVIVFTKTDRRPPEAVAANVKAFTDRIAPWFTELPAVLQCSAQTGRGRSELLGVVAATLAEAPEAAVPAPAAASLPAEIEPPFRLEVRAASFREKPVSAKKRLKGARPW